MDEKRRGELAYLYVKYALRFQSPINLNKPITSFTSNDWSLIKCNAVGGSPKFYEAWQIEMVLEPMVKEIKAEDYSSIPSLDEKDGLLEMMYFFLKQQFFLAKIFLDEKLRSELQRFCQIAKIEAAEGKIFFEEVLRDALERRLKFVLDKEDWEKQKVFLS